MTKDDMGKELYNILKALDFRYTPQQLLLMSKRDISVLISMIALYREELAEELNNV